MRNELEVRAVESVEIAKRAGAADAWVTAARSRSVSFSMRDGKLETVKDSTSRSLALKLFVDGRYSTHSTTDLRPERVKSFVADAVALTRALQPDEFRTMPNPELFATTIPDLRLEDDAVAKLDRDQRMRWCQEMDARVNGKAGVISSTAGVSDGSGMMAAASSNGFSGSYSTTSAALYTSITLDEGDRRPEGSSYASARHIAKLPSAQSIADDALVLARARLGATKGPTKRTRMVVDQRSSGSLIGRLLGPASGGSVQQERSFWADKLGTKVISDKLTVVDDPLIPGALGSRPFDGEGFAARKLPMITAGVFENLYLDTYYAKKLDMHPTTAGSSNSIVTLGQRGRDELVADSDGGIYVTSWLGGNMDSTTGDFSFGVRGHLIEDGKIGAPVGEMNVTGNIIDLFGRLAEVGNDPWVYSSTPAPTLVFDDVEFSGA